MYILKLMRNNRLELLASNIRRRRERDIFRQLSHLSTYLISLLALTGFIPRLEDIELNK